MARGATQHRLDDRPGPRFERPAVVVGPAGVENTDHLVAGHEGKADHVLEVPGAAPVERGQVRPADPREQRSEVEPVVGRELRLLGVEQLQGSDPGFASGAGDRGHPGGGETRQVALEDEGLHRGTPVTDRGSPRSVPPGWCAHAAVSPAGRAGRGAEAARNHRRLWPSARHAIPAAWRWPPAWLRG